MCGVRQGGVLSHLLFSVYVNDMIQKPCDEPWMLCWRCLLWLCYADDLIPVTASFNLLQRMIDTSPVVKKLCI